MTATAQCSRCALPVVTTASLTKCSLLTSTAGLCSDTPNACFCVPGQSMLRGSAHISLTTARLLCCLLRL